MPIGWLGATTAMYMICRRVASGATTEPLVLDCCRMHWSKFVAVSCLALSCSAKNDAEISNPHSAPDAQSSSQNVTTAATVWFDESPDTRIQVELARSTDEIRDGLMYREQMDDDKGMLFLMPAERVQSFWMKNTFIPLDMIFIRSDLSVAGVVRNAAPKTLTSRTVGVPSRYVLEVNAGWCDKHGVKTGSVATFSNVPAPPP